MHKSYNNLYKHALPYSSDPEWIIIGTVSILEQMCWAAHPDAGCCMFTVYAIRGRDLFQMKDTKKILFGFGCKHIYNVVCNEQVSKFS